MADIYSILTWLAGSLASEHPGQLSRPMVLGRARHWLRSKPPQPQCQLAVAGREASKSDAGYPLSKVWLERDRSGPAFWYFRLSGTSGFLEIPVFWYTKIRATIEVISVRACVYT